MEQQQQQDHQPQKMEALKKAYAEIILNTAKEAAGRAMASERKALCVQHDLRETKDEAVRMLMRFKQMIDVKTAQAETTSLSQQKRIIELDSQLNDTEGVIMDLRAEIRNAHERLAEMKNNRMLQSGGPSENEHVHQANTDVVTEQIRCSTPCSKSCNPEKEITTSDPNLASIIIGNNEPELYRNGYTHRIRAIERNSEKRTESKEFSQDQTSKTQRLPNRVGYTQSKHKLSRFCREKLNLKKKACEKDADLEENNENNDGTLRRSIRKRKVRCWDEISSLFKSRPSLSKCKKYSDTNGVKFQETKDEDTNHESAAKESVGGDCDGDKNRCLKYTFSRRSKKVLLSENEKPNVVDDSSSDSQNIIDVACQLISLSRERGR